MKYDRLRILAITSAPRRVRRLLGGLEPPGLPKAESMVVVVDGLAGGLRRLRRERFDAVFVDVSVIAKVPAAVRRLQRAALHVPVVTLLTDDTEGTAVEALKGGALEAFRAEAPALRAILRCLSHRKKAASELEDSRKRLQALFDHVPSAVLLADDAAQCVDANPAACRLLGYTRKELLKRSVWDVFHNLDKAEGSKLWKAFLARGSLGGEYEIQRKDGSGATAEFCAVAHIVPGLHLSVLRDISERRAADIRLQEYRVRLQALASELSLAEERERCRIASELHGRTVQSLGLCKIRLGTLREALPRAAERKLAEEIGALLDATIGDIRSLVFELSPPVLYELGFEPAVEWLAERFQQSHGIHCIVEDDRKLKPLAQELRVVLFQAVRELLANVAKHSRAKKVRVSLLRTGRRIEVAVEDDGVGFDAKSNKEPMETAKGFGLFHIQERMRLLGGEAQIESAPGKGARIRLQLPLAADEVR